MEKALNKLILTSLVLRDATICQLNSYCLFLLLKAEEENLPKANIFKINMQDEGFSLF